MKEEWIMRIGKLSKENSQERFSFFLLHYGKNDSMHAIFISFLHSCNHLEKKIELKKLKCKKSFAVKLWALMVMDKSAHISQYDEW